MSVSALVRFLVATFDWLETVAVPAARSAVHWVRTRCALWPEKLDLLRVRLSFWLARFRAQLEHRCSDLRSLIAHRREARRFRIQNDHVSRFLLWLRHSLIDALILAGSAAAFALFWLWAWTP